MAWRVRVGSLVTVSPVHDIEASEHTDTRW
jgi:hypothetical protein